MILKARGDAGLSYPPVIYTGMFLTPEELVELTGRKRRDAQAMVLRYMGIGHRIRPDGAVIVLRAHVEQLLGGKTEAKAAKRTEPDWDALKGRLNMDAMVTGLRDGARPANKPAKGRKK